jgi:hypothetical protein
MKKKKRNTSNKKKETKFKPPWRPNHASRTLPGCYTASGGNFLPTFRDNPSVPFLGGFKNPIQINSFGFLTLGGCPETSVRNCHYSLRNNLEEHSSYLLLRRKPEIAHATWVPKFRFSTVSSTPPARFTLSLITSHFPLECWFVGWHL